MRKSVFFLSPKYTATGNSWVRKVSPHVRRGARLRKKKEEERSGDGRHGYKMATVAMVIISDGRHGYKMATDA